MSVWVSFARPIIMQQNVTTLSFFTSFMLISASNPTVAAISLTLATLLWGVHFRMYPRFYSRHIWVLLDPVWNVRAACRTVEPRSGYVAWTSPNTVVSAVLLHAAWSSSQWNPAWLLLSLSWMKLENAVGMSKPKVQFFFMDTFSNSWWSSESNQSDIKNIQFCPLESGTISWHEVFRESIFSNWKWAAQSLVSFCQQFLHALRQHFYCQFHASHCLASLWSLFFWSAYSKWHDINWSHEKTLNCTRYIQQKL